MAVMSPASWDIAGVRSQEVRWILPGRLPRLMAEWFRRFPARSVTLEDVYLVSPHLPGLSVKVRAARALEVKAYHGNSGILELPERARGHVESWQKWSFPCDEGSSAGGDQAGWRTVRKRRRISRFTSVGGSTRACVPGPAETPGCAVELSDFHALGADWWTLGFEATGPADALRDQLAAAAALVFTRLVPGGVELNLADSMSYAQWLRGQAGIADGTSGIPVAAAAGDGHVTGC